MIYGTRNLVELKVGNRHTIQLQLHLRTCDIEWFNDHAKDKLYQIFSLLSKDVMPEVFNNEEIEINGKGKKEGATKSNKQTTGKKEKKRKATLKGADANASKKTKAQKVNKCTNVGQSLLSRNKKNETKKTYLSTMETKYLFANNIQMSYQVKPIQNSHRAVLTFGSLSKEVTVKTLSTFSCLKPLPKLILVWCYPFDPLNPKLPIMDTTVGFPRPEFLPLSSLFKKH